MKDFNIKLESAVLKDPSKGTDTWFVALKYKGTAGNVPIEWGERGPDVPLADIEKSFKAVFTAIGMKLFEETTK